MTQDQVNKNYDTFQRNWIGKRDDFDGIYRYQCVDIIKRYMYSYFGIGNGAYGNAIDYWYSTASAIANKFNRVNTKDVRKGDIVVLETNLTPIRKGKQPGHIGIASGVQTSTTVQILEQNGSTGNGSGLGNDAIRLRNVSKTRIAGILRPKVIVLPPPTNVPSGMPKVGQTVNIHKGQVRTTFVAGTTTVAGTIRATANDFNYLIRGYDPKYPNRGIINTASGGGNGVALAFFYTDGRRIDGWSIK